MGWSSQGIPADAWTGSRLPGCRNLARAPAIRLPGHGRPSLRHRRDPAADREPGGGSKHPTQANKALEGVLQSGPVSRQDAIERMLCRLKDWRRIATRYDKLAANFLAAIQIAVGVRLRPPC